MNEWQILLLPALFGIVSLAVFALTQLLQENQEMTGPNF